MIDLSSSTSQHVATLFAPEERRIVEQILAHECADNLPLLGDPITPEGLERIRFAALRVSGGRLSRLREAVQLAKTDWRDLLIGADFADDIQAHRTWKPRPLDPARLDRWRGGSLPEGVEFGPNDAVEVLVGPSRGAKGAVISLVALDPEPRYKIELGSGEELEGDQRVLRGAGGHDIAADFRAEHRDVIRTGDAIHRLGMRVRIERFVDEAPPGWVECRLVDAAGAAHLFREKVPVVTAETLDAHSAYPREGIIGCTVVGARVAGDGRELVTVDTEQPWGIESTVGRAQFEVFRDQVVEFTHEAG